MTKPSRRRATETGGPDHRVTTTSSAKVELTWRVRVAARVLTEDVSRIGRDTYERARKAIQKKLTLDPEQYGERLHSPLHGLYKLTSSNIRVAYRIEVSTRDVWVLLIGDRQTIWDVREGEILDSFVEQRHSAPVQRSERDPSAGSAPPPAKRRRPHRALTARKPPPTFAGE